MENLILTKHDWNNETPFVKSFLQSKFGNQCKQKASEYMSWKGLENTDEFTLWAQNNGLTANIDINGNTTYPDYNNLIVVLQVQGKKDCI